MNTKAWMLRNDGVSFPVHVHLYTMQDDDFSSEAEVASFLIKCSNADHDLAEYCLDAWMAKLVEDSATSNMTADEIDDVLCEELTHLPYRFPYPLTVDEYLAIHLKLDNWSDFSSLALFCQEITANPEPIWESMTQSLNQQFCRSRYGGKYNSDVNSGDMWFRISSVGFNWSDVIYIWVANNLNSMHIKTVTVCRDAESDYGFEHADKPDYFYRAKDGQTYYLMPVDDFLAGDHESNPVFAQTEIGRGPRRVLSTMLGAGYSIRAAEEQSGLTFSEMRPYYLRNERRHCECVKSSVFLDEAHPKVQGRMSQLEKRIESQYPNVLVQDIDLVPYEFATGRKVDSIVVSYTLNGMGKVQNIQIVLNKGLARTTVDEMMRQVRMMFK